MFQNKNLLEKYITGFEWAHGFDIECEDTSARVKQSQYTTWLENSQSEN